MTIINPVWDNHTARVKVYEMERDRQNMITSAWFFLWFGGCWIIIPAIVSGHLAFPTGVAFWLILTGACVLLGNMAWLRRI